MNFAETSESSRYSRRYGRAWYVRWIVPHQIASLLVPAILFQVGAGQTLAVLLALGWNLALLLPTFNRLEDAGLTGWLVAIEFLQLRFGPSWDGLGFAPLYSSQIVYLIPIALACVLPSAGHGHSGDNARSV